MAIILLCHRQEGLCIRQSKFLKDDVQYHAPRYINDLLRKGPSNEQKLVKEKSVLGLARWC